MTLEVGKAVQESKAGKVEFRVNKEAGMHVPIGKVSFTDEQLYENFVALMDAVVKSRPRQPRVPSSARFTCPAPWGLVYG